MSQSAVEPYKDWRTRHGMSRSPEYRVYLTMRQRCENPNDRSFQEYGGRGITACERWQTFENFIAGMGPRPSGRFTIERKDGNLGYSLDNCVWATYATQNRNLSRNVNLAFNGRTQCLMDWALELGIKPNTLIYRIRRGWTTEKALSSETLSNSATLDIARRNQKTNQRKRP